jgi:predicted Zn-dependent protease/predicted aspartyl protease
MSLDKELEYRTTKNSSVKKYTLIALAILVCAGGTIFFQIDKACTEKADAAYAVAKDLVDQEDYDSALEKLDEAISQKRKSQFYHLKYQILQAQEKYNEAEISLEKAIENDPKNTYYLYQSAVFYCNRGADPDKGIERLKRIVSIEPKNSDYRLTYGATLAQFGKFEEGIKVLEQLLKEDPNYENVWNDLAAIYNYAGYPDKALKMRQEAVKRYPKSAGHWFWLGNIYDLQNNKSKAVEAYRKSIALEPESGGHAAYRIAQLTGSKVPEQYREIIEDGVPVVFRNTHAFVRAEVAGYTGVFLLDTGATDTILYERFLDKHQLDIGEDNPTTKYETAGGIISAPILYADIKIARFNIQNARVAVIDDPKQDKYSDGIIGMNVLKNFNVRLDNLKGRILLSRK